MYELVRSLPEEQRPEDEGKLWKALALELSSLLEYGANTQEPEIVLTTFKQHGSQFIAEFWINDLSVPKANKMNFHGQNTSQWKYAGAILVQNREVSLHH